MRKIQTEDISGISNDLLVPFLFIELQVEFLNWNQISSENKSKTVVCSLMMHLYLNGFHFVLILCSMSQTSGAAIWFFQLAISLIILNEMQKFTSFVVFLFDERRQSSRSPMKREMELFSGEEKNKVHLPRAHSIFICTNWFRSLWVYNSKYSKTIQINAK